MIRYLGFLVSILALAALCHAVEHMVRVDVDGFEPRSVNVSDEDWVTFVSELDEVPIIIHSEEACSESAELNAEKRTLEKGRSWSLLVSTWVVGNYSKVYVEHADRQMCEDGFSSVFDMDAGSLGETDKDATSDMRDDESGSEGRTVTIIAVVTVGLVVFAIGTYIRRRRRCRRKVGAADMGGSYPAKPSGYP